MTEQYDLTGAIDAAARAVYAKTPTAQSVEWDLLPRNVQHEIREMALTAVSAALRHLRLGFADQEPKTLKRPADTAADLLGLDDTGGH